jgi:hypothetical protein
MPQSGLFVGGLCKVFLCDGVFMMDPLALILSFLVM